MKVIWKRPDGYLGASPSDFTEVEIDDKLKIWLHKQDCDNFPFRVSGGWQEEDSTKKLNNLVNLLGQPDAVWKKFLESGFRDSRQENLSGYLTELAQWLNTVAEQLKGDSWEVAMMTDTLGFLRCKIESFLESAIPGEISR